MYHKMSWNFTVLVLNYHWIVSWEYKLDLWTLIVMEDVPTLSAVSLSVLFFWNQLGAINGRWLYMYSQSYAVAGSLKVVT